MSLDADGPGAASVSRERLERVRGATSLADLARLFEAESEREAYLEAKSCWAERTLDRDGVTDGLPGSHVRIGSTDYYVHGITHADTGAERAVVREHVAERLADGAAVYCEEGIRGMYLDDFEGVCAMDDYRWALARCEELAGDADQSGLGASEFAALVADVAGATDGVKDAAFSLIDSGSALYGEDVTAALGEAASSILADPTDLATGEDFEAFRRTRRAAADPDRLADLQDYYRRVLLPQPLERAWLRRLDPQVELVTHARNERMADYVVHEAGTDVVEVLVGAAHQPGVTYYLEQYRDGHRQPGDFEYAE